MQSRFHNRLQENETDRLAADPAAVYPTLAAHQRTESWQGKDLAAALQVWAERFNVEFKLDIPEMALRLDQLPISTRGHFRQGHNGFGLKGEVALNMRLLTGDSPPLLHMNLYELEAPSLALAAAGRE